MLVIQRVRSRRFEQLIWVTDSHAVSFLYATISFYPTMFYVREEYARVHNHHGSLQWNRIRKKLQNP